jgi:excisionase family DNA binding protein
MARPKRPVRHFQPLLTVRQAAARLGISVDDAYLWIRKGALPHIRVGPKPGVIRVHPRDCDPRK